MVDDENLHTIGPDERSTGGDASNEEPGEGRPEVLHERTPQSEDRPEALGERGPRSKEHSARKHAKKSLKEAEHAERKAAELGAQNETLQAEVKELKDKWLRSAAEFENFRKRTRKEWELLQQRTKAEIILEVLAVVDDFERAFSMAGDRDDDFIRGMRLIYNNLMSSLERAGVRKIEALGAVFDPAYHMAVAQIERDGANSNHVVEIVQEGYCLGDLLVRPAKVIIAK